MPSFDTVHPRTMEQAKILPILAFAVLVVGIWLASYWQSVMDIVGIWERSDTFAHGFIVLPISATLIWMRRDHLAGCAPRPAWNVLPCVWLAISGWLLGLQVSLAALEHFSVVAILVFSIWYAIGHRAFRAVAFPVLFLMFMAPVGEFLLPVLMHYTAEFTVGALRLTGVPVYQESLYFVLPNGRWSVVEACSGIRYLIASLMVGMLYAYLNYQSTRKRLVFVLISLVVPIVANWLRAYMIVMIGFLSNNQLAAGVDHLIYGWVFFGVVVVLMFAIGNRWRDPDAMAVAPETEIKHKSGREFRQGALGFAVISGCLVAGALIGGAIAPVDRSPRPLLNMPSAAEGWVQASADEQGFRPSFSGFRAEGISRYQDRKGDVVLYVAVFADQVKGHEMVNWDNQLVPSSSEWRIVARGQDLLPGGPAEHVRVSGPTGNLNIWRWYRVGEKSLISGYKAKAVLSWNRLVLQQDSSAHVVLIVPDEDEARARARARSFLVATGDGLNASLTSAMDSAR